MHPIVRAPTVVPMSVAATESQPANRRPPRDGLLRLWSPGQEDGVGVAVREADSSGTSAPTLFGHFAVFNRWTEIDSFFEGNFMERIAPGAFKKTFKEQRDAIRLLFQHGRDETLGMKPMGTIKTLKEDREGAYYEAPLFKGVPDIIMEGLRNNQYGASFKFRVVREGIRSNVEPYADNPKGLDERTIQELQLFEFGPVTFPAYAEATAGLRSLTDDYFLDGIANADPDLVRAAADGVDLAGLIARRLGIDSPRGISVPRSVENKPAEKQEETDVKYEVRHESTLPASASYGVYAEDGTLVACFATEDAARAYSAPAHVETPEEPVEEPAEAPEEEPERGGEGAAAAEETREAPDTDTTAAPEGFSTPLIGPSGYRESWRL